MITLALILLLTIQSKLYKCDSDCPCTFEVLSIDHEQGAASLGKYFHFDKSIIDCMLEGANWHDNNFDVYDERTHNVNYVILWRSPNGGSIGDAHGRKDDGLAAAGDWQVGDILSIVNHVITCQEPVCPIPVLSIDHNQGALHDGKYFNFDTTKVDSVLGQTGWAGQNFGVYNSRTKQVKKTILWDSKNGGSIGDGHGREDDGTAVAGDWQVGDQISIVGIPSPVGNACASNADCPFCMNCKDNKCKKCGKACDDPSENCESYGITNNKDCQCRENCKGKKCRAAKGGGWKCLDKSVCCCAELPSSINSVCDADLVVQPDDIHVVSVVDKEDFNPAAAQNDNNITPESDMFGNRNAKPSETYSILVIIIIAGIIILIVTSLGIYRYITKRRAENELNEMDQINQNEIEIEKATNQNENTLMGIANEEHLID